MLSTFRNAYKDFQKEIGVGEHTDYGLLTILKQAVRSDPRCHLCHLSHLSCKDMVGGLQARNEFWNHGKQKLGKTKDGKGQKLFGGREIVTTGGSEPAGAGAKTAKQQLIPAYFTYGETSSLAWMYHINSYIVL